LSVPHRHALAPLSIAVALASPASAASLAEAIGNTYWGETPQALQRQLANRAVTLSRPIDFGDSYAPLIMRGVRVGGVEMIAYYQIDKATLGLKRVQLERPRHQVNAAAFRALFTAFGNRRARPIRSVGSGPGRRAATRGLPSMSGVAAAW